MKAQYNSSQEQIVRVLKSLKIAISAQDLYLELKHRDRPLGLATVYRALDALKVQGSVKSLTLTSGEALYSLISQDQHHLTCLDCGKSLPINECPVHHLEKRLEQAHQFKVYYHTLEFFGRCNQCYAKSVL